MTVLLLIILLNNFKLEKEILIRSSAVIKSSKVLFICKKEDELDEAFFYVDPFEEIWLIHGREGAIYKIKKNKKIPLIINRKQKKRLWTIHPSAIRVGPDRTIFLYLFPKILKKQGDVYIKFQENLFPIYSNFCILDNDTIIYDQRIGKNIIHSDGESKETDICDVFYDIEGKRQFALYSGSNPENCYVIVNNDKKIIIKHIGGKIVGVDKDFNIYLFQDHRGFANNSFQIINLTTRKSKIFRLNDKFRILYVSKKKDIYLQYETKEAVFLLKYKLPECYSN